MPRRPASQTVRLSLRVTPSMAAAVKKHAKARGIPYTRFVREAMEAALARPEKRERR